MRLSIKYKLFFAILSAHVIVYIALYSIGKSNFDRGFLDYISQIEEQQVPALVAGLSSFYEHTGSWDPIRRNSQKWVALIRESIESVYRNSIESINNPAFVAIQQSSRRTPGRFSPNDWYYSSEYSPARPYLMLLDAEKNLIYGNRVAYNDTLHLANLNPIVARGETVGFLAVTSRQELSEQADVLFAEQQKQSFLIFATVLVGISALIAFPMSSFLVRPIHEIVGGTRALTNGDYSSRLKVRGSDELAQLAQDFNTLARTLDQNRAARQQWIADISHELRTPLAILRAELESVQDGIRPLTQETLNSLHQEVIHLNALVNDLHELSMSDLGALIYEKEELDINSVVEHTIDMHRQLLDEHEIKLIKQVETPNADDEVTMLGDDKRMIQLFSNLLQNTCRYTNSGGDLIIKIKETQDEVRINWEDSAPEVSNEDLGHLFERLYRVDSSRNRTQGGSGLGLAICMNIVKAHEGSISAEHSKLGGLKISITFPRKLRNL